MDCEDHVAFLIGENGWLLHSGVVKKMCDLFMEFCVGFVCCDANALRGTSVVGSTALPYHKIFH